MQFSLHTESRFESLFLNCWKKIKNQKEKETYVSLSHHKELHFWTKKENTCTKKKKKKKKAASESLNPIGPTQLAH